MPRRGRGFSLIELLIAMVVIAILIAIAFPSYQRYLVRASREQAQTLLLQLAVLEEKIFLNSTSYVFNDTKVIAGYTGDAAGGLGLTNRMTPDGRYTITLATTSTATTFKLTATPVAGTPQASDGNITIDDAGTRLWNGKAW